MRVTNDKYSNHPTCLDLSNYQDVQDHEQQTANVNSTDDSTNGHHISNGEDTISPTDDIDNGTEHLIGSSEESDSSPDEGDLVSKEADHERSHDTKMELDLTHSHVIEVQPRIAEEEPEAGIGLGNEVELPGNIYMLLVL